MDCVVPFASLEAGIEFRFRGIERDADGEPIGEMVDVALVLPPLNLDSLNRVRKAIENVAQGNVDSMADLLEITLRALKQNYRSVPRWLVEQSIDVANTHAFVRAVMDVGGTYRKELEAAKALAGAGEEMTHG